MGVSEQEVELLRGAVNLIVADERKKFPEQDEAFWDEFQDVLLAVCIERREELLR